MFVLYPKSTQTLLIAHKFSHALLHLTPHLLRLLGWLLFLFLILQLQNHYHPSVALFAKTLRDGLKVHYMGNPLHDFTLMKFLDRFVYRNPKKQAENGTPLVLDSDFS